MSSNRLRKLRKDKKIDLEKILKHLNISMSYYYQLERADKRLNEDILKKLADFYGVTIDYLLARTDCPKYTFVQHHETSTIVQIELAALNMVKSALNSGLSMYDIQEVLEFARKIKLENK